MNDEEGKGYILPDEEILARFPPNEEGGAERGPTRREGNVPESTRRAVCNPFPTRSGRNPGKYGSNFPTRSMCTYVAKSAPVLQNPRTVHLFRWTLQGF